MPQWDVAILQHSEYHTLRRVALALDAGLARDASSKLHQYILQRASHATTSQCALTPAQCEAAARMYALEVMSKDSITQCLMANASSITYMLPKKQGAR